MHADTPVLPVRRPFCRKAAVNMAEIAVADFMTCQNVQNLRALHSVVNGRIVQKHNRFQAQPFRIVQ